MTIDGTRFGAIDYEEEDVLTFREGLIGFPNGRRYLLLSLKDDSPFRWLQSLEEPALAFLVADPAHWLLDYEPVVRKEIAQALALTEETPRFLLTTAVIPPGRPDEMTLNLAGPLLINAETRQGAQVVLEDDAYTIRHRVFQSANRVSASAAA
jgi:flagellar assembly factor FliW